jgi:hypothetical protein
MEVTTMKLTLWILVAFAVSLPALIVAIALGPVIIGVLCAAGLGLLVFAIANVLIAIGVAVEMAGARLSGHR